MNSKLKVTPEELRGMKDELNTLLNRARGGYTKLVSNLICMDTYIVCSANSLIKRELISSENATEDIFVKLSGHIEGLEAIAMEYELSERSNRDAANGIH